MKNEDELLDLIAATHSLGNLKYIKDYLAENVIYDTLGLEQPVIGKEGVCAKIGYWFQYNINLSVSMEAIKHKPTEKSIGYVSLSEDGYKIGSYVIIESEGGLITRYYEVGRNQTRRLVFQNLKETYFEPRAKMISRQGSFTLEEMRSQVERVNVRSLESVKESIKNAKTDPTVKAAELVREQAEIANMFQDALTISLPVVRLSNDKVRYGTWYEIVQPDQQESTICLTRPFYFERMPFWGTGLLIIQHIRRFRMSIAGCESATTFTSLFFVSFSPILHLLKLKSIFAYFIESRFDLRAPVYNRSKKKS